MTEATRGPERGRKVTVFGAWLDARPHIKVVELAERLEVRPATIYNLRAGRTRASLELAARIELVTNGDVPATAMLQKAKRVK